MLSTVREKRMKVVSQSCTYSGHPYARLSTSARKYRPEAIKPYSSSPITSYPLPEPPEVCTHCLHNGLFSVAAGGWGTTGCQLRQKLAQEPAAGALSTKLRQHGADAQQGDILLGGSQEGSAAACGWSLTCLLSFVVHSVFA